MTKNILVMGHIDHGKTALIRAINKLYNSKDERVLSIGSTEAVVTAGTDSYRFYDFPGPMDYEKNFTGKDDAVVIVCAATDGPMPQTRDHLQMCSDKGIKKIAFFMNKADLVDDEELLELTYFDIVACYEEYGYEDSSLPIITGSAKVALVDPAWSESVKELVDTVINML